MVLKKIILIALLSHGWIPAMAQVINGKVTDALSKPLAGAVVHILNTPLQTVTGQLGEFSLGPVPAGKYQITISAPGYATVNQAISVTSPATNIVFRLKDVSIQLSAVVVSAEKKEEALLQVPAGITAISAPQAEDLRLWDTKDLTAVAPNLYAANPGDDRNVTSIRGIVTTSYDPAVATYIDGVNQFSLDTYMGGLDDIERIEILRGPQGTLYGRNAMGGVINIISKAPADVTSGTVSLSEGNFGEQRYAAEMRLPVIRHLLYFGISGIYNTRDGYYTNLFDNSSFDRQHGFSGNYSLRCLPGKHWDLQFNVKQQDNVNYGTFPLVNGDSEALGQPFKLSQNAVAAMFDHTLNASLSVTKSGARIHFASQTAWQQNYRYYNAPLDGDFSPADAVTIINNYGKKWNNVKVFTQEFRATSPAGTTSPFKWTAGTYFFYQDNPSKQATHFGKDAALVGAPDTDFSTITTATGRNEGIALYGQATYAFTENLSVVAGLRLDYENKRLDVEGQYQKDGAAALISQADTAATLHFSALSPKLALQYLVGTGNNLYISYTRGYRTGGLTQLSSDPSQPPLYPYQPEFSNNFEAGYKRRLLQDRLNISFAAFFTGVDNAQVPTLVLPQAITVTKNTGKLTSKGAEVEVSSTPFRGFDADYSFGYTDAKYTSLQLAENGVSIDLKGSRQIFTPRETSLLAAEYSHPIGAFKKLKVIGRVEWQYLGTEYFDLANTIRQSPYSLWNLRFGIASRHLSLFLWSRNTGDKKYISYAYDFGAVHLGDPATFGTTISLRL